jgi:predicted MFS family arabinose efflux permease
MANKESALAELVSMCKPLVTILTWMPSRCRYTSAQELHFSLPLNLLFGLASTITAANLYYSYSVLNRIAYDFGIGYERASLIPTLMQAGYGSGILLLCPFGDLSRIRPFILSLIILTATTWVSLCLITNFKAFCAMSYITGFTTVTPQLMLPLASRLAPPAQQATAISIVFSGLTLGSLLPRVLSGIVAEYTAWRNIYWSALGFQSFIFVLLWAYMPDYPSLSLRNNSFLRIFWSIVELIFKQPVVTYACIMTFFANAVFASYWTTITALLSSPPYAYSSLKIGLFNLIGIAPLTFVPPYSRIIIDRFVPNLSVTLGLIYAIIGVVVGSYIGTRTIAGVIIEAIGIDFGVQTASIAYRAAIYAAVPSARNRTNVAYTVSAFAGQLMGTSVGNHFYARGGWAFNGKVNVGFLGAALVVTLIRGPSETHWIGWRGGLSMRRADLNIELQPTRGRDEIAVMESARDADARSSNKL